MTIDAIPDISVVVFQRDKWWIAQCLQYDIGAQAFTIEDVLYELERSMVGHIAIAVEHGRQPFAELPAAPPVYWNKFRGTTVRIQSADAPFRVPGALHAPKPEIRMAS